MDIHTDTFGGEYPFKGNYVEVNGVRLHYVDEHPEGNPKAEPIVMLHGNPTWSFLYRKFIPPLVKAGYRAIAVDHIGYGRSDTPRDRSLYRLKNRIGFFTKERLTDEVMRAYRAPFPDYHSRIATMAIQDVPFEEDHPSRPTMKSIEARLKGLNVAVLLCWGEDDELLPSARMFEIWKQFYPHAETALVPRAGHFLQEDAPDDVVDNILKFMAKYR